MCGCGDKGPAAGSGLPLPDRNAPGAAQSSPPPPPLTDPQCPAARRAPQSSPAPKVSLMHLESVSESPVCVTWRRPPLLGAQASERASGETARRTHFAGACECAPGSGPRLLRADPRRALSVPAPCPRPARAPRCGGLGGGGSRRRRCHRSHSRLWSF